VNGERDDLLRVSGLRKHFGGVKAVDGATFSVPQGTVVGLIGPNGAGKSTAIDLISGFTPADAGSAVFDGRELLGLGPHRVSRLGLIRTFQSPREWPSLTVFDNLMLAARQYPRESAWRSLFTWPAVRRAEGPDRELVRDAARRFGLDHLINTPAGTLSGGQKRLVEFARIAIAKPKLIVLDEPMGGVNPVLGERIGQAVRDFASEGSSVLIVEHNLRFIEETCDEVVVMSLGAVIAQGPYDSLRSNAEVVDAYLGAVQDHV
jgi:branched-chain amino acid transport system ATP-binding protein